MESNDIAVFILDLRMPDMDGVQLCRLIKDKQPISCIYALTAHAGDYHVDQCRAAGFDDYFHKPVSMSTLLKAAEDAFEKLDRWKKK